MFCDFEESVSCADSLIYSGIQYNRTDNLISDVIKTCGVLTLNELLTCIDSDTKIITLNSHDRLRKCLNTDISITSLSSLLELPQSSSLYEIFSYYFDTEGTPLTDLEMINLILSSLATKLLNMQYVYCVSMHDSYCWFYVDAHSRVNILGSSNFDVVSEKYQCYERGTHKKVLSYKMAISGCSLFHVKYLTYNDLKESLFDTVPTLQGLSYEKVVSTLSTNLVLNYRCTAYELVLALSQSSVPLGLRSTSTGNLTCNSVFLKDFSICTTDSIEKSRGKWGIIIDCEGNKNNQSGLRELGGIIFCKYKDKLISVQTFECTEVLLEDTLIQVIKDYEEGIGRYIPSRGIDIYTYGGVDAVMFEESLRNVSSKQFRRKMKRLFHFHDCRTYIYNYLNEYDKLMQDKKTLSNVAKVLNVAVIQPKHNAIADCRTLFNILAYILQETGSWVLNL